MLLDHLAESRQLDQRMDRLRAEQKSIIIRLAEQGATPEELEDGLLAALVHLRGTQQHTR
jgi:hypothetical protein